ncbi:hypothetical protein A4X06_0g4462 [Tilletia controversa]|uniref:Uncharacterized protein n=1 Tax=Tilletia controversa TaxID=13291 RepID=A0A8X7SWH3_9BASI|nr:hypothetical protein A4X06_0g4462 [Tilletia controversa]
MATERDMELDPPSSPLFPPHPDHALLEFPFSQPPSQIATARIRSQLQTGPLQSSSSRASVLEPPAPFAAQTAYMPSQQSRPLAYEDDDQPLPDAVWTQPQTTSYTAVSLSGSEDPSANRVASDAGIVPQPYTIPANHDPADRTESNTATTHPSPSSLRRDDVLSSAAALVSLAQLPSTSLAQSPTRPFSPAPRSTEPHYWVYRRALTNTPAHFYLGPLEPSRVLDLLSSPELSKHARLGLTSTGGGYLKYFHFLGHSTIPTLRQRPKKPTNSATTTTGEASTPTATISAQPSAPAAITAIEEREWWQCRCCHGDFHVPPNHVTNLGAHLYGTSKSRGCLELREANPAEPVLPPARDVQGKIIRIRPDTPTPAARALRGPRKKKDAVASSV